jgi:hypothetical protein
MSRHASRDKKGLLQVGVPDTEFIQAIQNGLNINSIVTDYLESHPPTGGLSINQIKADTEIADAINKKHSDEDDHAPGSDNQDLSNLVVKETGKGLYPDADATKLAGLSNYTHPANHLPSIITQDASNRFVTDTEKSTWNNKGSSNLALGDLAANAYPGDKGKTAYDHSQATHAPLNAQKNSDITKSEIESVLTGEISSHTHAGSGGLNQQQILRLI